MTQHENARNGPTIEVQVVDPQGFTIYLYRHTWERHILRNHPDMVELLDLVTKTLAEPEVIQQAPQEPTTHYYYRLAGRRLLRRDDLFVAVVVSRDAETRTGFVKTAHLVNQLRRSEDIVWFKRT